MWRSAKVPAVAVGSADLSAEWFAALLASGERAAKCSTATRNQRLGSIHALARFIGGAQSTSTSNGAPRFRMVRIKKGVACQRHYGRSREIDACLQLPNRSSSQGARDHALLLFLYNSGARVVRRHALGSADIDWQRGPAGSWDKGARSAVPARANTSSTSSPDRKKAWPHVSACGLNRRGEPTRVTDIHTMVERYVASCGHQPATSRQAG